MRAADLHDIREFVGFGLQRSDQRIDCRQQRIARGQGRGNMQRGGKAVVRALRHVDVIIGMDRALAATRARQLLVGDTRDHFVDVHIGLRAAAGLEDGQGEFLVELARADRGRGIFDRGDDRCIEPVLAVGPCRGLLHCGLAVNDTQRHLLVRGKGEVLQAALRLRAPICRAGNFDRSDGIGFGARLAHRLSPCCRFRARLDVALW